MHGILLPLCFRLVSIRCLVCHSTITRVTELMRSLWMQPVARANERLEVVAKAQPQPVQRTRELLESYVEFARDNHVVYRHVVMWVRPEGQPLPEAQPLSAFPMYALLAEALREGQEQGQIRAGDPDQMAQVLWASLHGALTLPVHIDGAAFTPPEELAHATIQQLLDSIVV